MADYCCFCIGCAPCICTHAWWVCVCCYDVWRLLWLHMSVILAWSRRGMSFILPYFSGLECSFFSAVIGLLRWWFTFSQHAVVDRKPKWTMIITRWRLHQNAAHILLFHLMLYQLITFSHVDGATSVMQSETYCSNFIIIYAECGWPTGNGHVHDGLRDHAKSRQWGNAIAIQCAHDSKSYRRYVSF